MFRSLITGGVVYFTLGLLMIGFILLSLLLGAAGTGLSGGFGEASGFVTFTLVFLEIALMPIGWFILSPVLTGGWLRQPGLGALGAGFGFSLTSGVSGMVSLIYITIQYGLEALSQGATDGWAPWILLLILAGAWLIGILISSGLGALSGLILKTLIPPAKQIN
ncbi:MAG TPA: hypothetical protein PKW33_08910 [Anaerolineaceae bacterium]|nr:hypothetical protein [Anaerolineaceae bacterium]HPN51694.1 hypothetical protein [Anaerolineaceae bacterium]